MFVVVVVVVVVAKIIIIIVIIDFWWCCCFKGIVWTGLLELCSCRTILGDVGVVVVVVVVF